MKLCPNCEKENPSSANNCMHCGASMNPKENAQENEKEKINIDDIKKTNKELKAKLDSKLKEEKLKTEKVKRKTEVPSVTKPLPKKEEKKKTGLIITLVGIALVVFGVFYYFNIFIPAKIDREAPRYYTFADKLNLRYSKQSGVDYNLVTSLNYGSELITYDYSSGGWSKVKDGNGHKGYVSSDYLLDKKDFTILNSIFGDTDSKDCINTAKCRLALLNYFKKNNLGDDWAVYCRPKNMKPNAVYYKRIVDKNSKFTDFAVIIKNKKSGLRKLLLFGFQDDESVAWSRDLDAPYKGYIEKIKYRGGSFYVDYSSN